MFFTIVGFLALALILLLVTAYLGVVTFVSCTEFGGNVEGYVWFVISIAWGVVGYFWYLLFTNAPFAVKLLDTANNLG